MPTLTPNVLDIIEELLAQCPGIQSIRVTEFPSQGSLQDKLKFTDAEAKQVRRALAIRELIDLPFWDALHLTSFSNEHFSSRFLRQAKSHNQHPSPQTLRASRAALEGYLETKAGRNVALCSRVNLSTGEERHIPLLDFHCPNNRANAKLAASVVQELEVSGYLLESGDSYHFYGNKLLRHDEFIRFLGLALQYAPIVDRAWIAHQLRELMAALRITSKEGVTPFLVQRCG